MTACSCQKAKCMDCDEPIPSGQGLGWSAPEDEWPDKSTGRPIVRFDPLCKSCIVRRMFEKPVDRRAGQCDLIGHE